MMLGQHFELGVLTTSTTKCNFKTLYATVSLYLNNTSRSQGFKWLCVTTTVLCCSVISQVLLLTKLLQVKETSEFHISRQAVSCS